MTEHLLVDFFHRNNNNEPYFPYDNFFTVVRNFYSIYIYVVYLNSLGSMFLGFVLVSLYGD